MQAVRETLEARHHPPEDFHADVAAAEDAGDAFALPLGLLFFDGGVGQGK
jgi:hypothetical protein